MGVWLGLLLVLVFSSLTTDRAGPNPTQRNWVFGRLNREHTFGQTFIAGPGELIGMRVLLFANSGSHDEQVVLHLRYTEGELPALAVVALPLQALNKHTWSIFEIQPLTLNLTTTLRLEIESPTLPPNEWVSVMAGPDTYPDGELFVDDTPRPFADLAFQPVYRRRWIDDVLPITRMALGKPGLLGWPPLYTLLAYGSIVVLAQLLLTLWRAVRHAVDAH